MSVPDPVGAATSGKASAATHQANMRLSITVRYLHQRYFPGFCLNLVAPRVIASLKVRSTGSRPMDLSGAAANCNMRRPAARLRVPSPKTA